MFISVRRYKVNSADIPEISKRAQEGFAPIIKGSPGFIAYYGVDQGDGNLATISVFEDQAGAEESNRRAADWVKKNLAKFIDSPPQLSTGNVMWSA